MQGQVVHFEIPADDLDRARTFYREAFGWGVDAVPEMDYTMVQTTETDDEGMPRQAGAINGGMLKRQEPVTTPVITIAVEDIDEASANIEKLGGSVVRAKMPVGDMGYAAYFNDTEGNIVGLWQSATG